jgi:HK97 family phage prohead protease
MSTVETKFLNVAFEVKAEGDKGEFTGYGSVFGNVDSYRDVVVKGAFAETIREGKTIPVLWQHDSREPIGVFVELREDDRGLFVKGNINMETQRGRESFALLKQGAIKGLSIGFITKESIIDDMNNVRKLTDVDLMEISLVTFPANVEAEVVGVKNAGDIMSIQDFERFLREAGKFSKDASRIVAGKGYKALLERCEAADGEVNDSKSDGELEGVLKALEDFNSK